MFNSKIRAAESISLRHAAQKGKKPFFAGAHHICAAALKMAGAVVAATGWR